MESKSNGVPRRSTLCVIFNQYELIKIIADAHEASP